MIKHADANEAELLLGKQEAGFLVRAADDGVGFAPGRALSAPGGDLPLGLTSSAEG